MIRVGCSGWNYRDWRGAFYPEDVPARRWLEVYAERFDTVEVNATFYRLPSRDAVAHWVEQTPEDFVFTVKGSRYLTHMKRLQDTGEGLRRFFSRVTPLVEAGRLGPVLWQLPATFRRDDDRLAAFLDALPEGRHAFEFRDASWFTDDVLERLADRDAALVHGDDPRRPLATPPSPATWAFVRFHHGHRGRDGNYGPKEIAGWADAIAGRAGRGDDVYVYFNNDWEAFAPRNAEALRERLEETRGVAVG